MGGRAQTHTGLSPWNCSLWSSPLSHHHIPSQSPHLWAKFWHWLVGSCLGFNCVPPKNNVEVLTPSTCNDEVWGNRVFADIIKLGWGHTRLRWALIQWLVSLQEEGNLDSRGDTDTGRASRDDRGSDGSVVPASQGCQELPETTRSQGEAGKHLSSGGLRGSRALLPPWFQASRLQSYETRNDCCPTTPVCGSLLQQPRKQIQLPFPL